MRKAQHFVHAVRNEQDEAAGSRKRLHRLKHRLAIGEVQRRCDFVQDQDARTPDQSARQHDQLPRRQRQESPPASRARTSCWRSSSTLPRRALIVERAARAAGTDRRNQERYCPARFDRERSALPEKLSPHRALGTPPGSGDRSCARRRGSRPGLAESRPREV